MFHELIVMNFIITFRIIFLENNTWHLYFREFISKKKVLSVILFIFVIIVVYRMNQKIKAIADGWIELESDPGLFTLLIDDFGVKGVEVEEIYDLQTLLQGPVYGFIFLFKWLEGGRRSRRAKFELASGVAVTDESSVNSVFFAHQKVQNSCATHAILSILMNSDEIELGSLLSEFKSFTKDMSPEAKGFALNNLPDLSLAHNKHARPDAWRDVDDDSEKGSTIASSSSAVSTKWQETFHFASYLPINGHLYEMDSLKPYPIDHGSVPDGIEWQQYFQQLISDRIASAGENGSHEIRYNLMALVPCKIDKLKEKLNFLTSNRNQLILALRSLVTAIDPDVFRRVLQMSSFSQRKKLSDTELFQAAEHLLPFEIEPCTSTEEQCTKNDNENNVSLENMAELGCAPNSSTLNLLLTFPVEDYEICTEPRMSHHCSVISEESSDFVELSEQSCSTSLLPKNNQTSRKLVKIKLAPSSQEFESLTLREIVSYVKLFDEELRKINRLIDDERSRRRQFEIDDQRRTHDYDNFTRKFFAFMSMCGILEKDDTKNGKVKKTAASANINNNKQKPPLLQRKRQNNKRKLSKDE